MQIIRDQFGFLGQAANYQKFRPQYPEKLLQAIYQSIISKNVALDLGCGTGEHFKQVFGIDQSENQLQQARQAYSHMKNIVFIQSDTNKLGEFLEKEKIQKLDLICIAQALHWFDYQTFLPYISNIVTKYDSTLCVLTYPKMEILSKVKYEQLLTDGLIQPINEPKFQHSELISNKFDAFFELIYPYFECDRRSVDNNFKDLNFSLYFKKIKQEMFIQIKQNYSLLDLAGYMDTISAYRCYLEKQQIQQGTEKDPLFSFIQKILDETNEKNVRFDLIQRFYLISLEN